MYTFKKDIFLRWCFRCNIQPSRSHSTAITFLNGRHTTVHLRDRFLQWCFPAPCAAEQKSFDCSISALGLSFTTLLSFASTGTLVSFTPSRHSYCGYLWQKSYDCLASEWCHIHSAEVIRLLSDAPIWCFLAPCAATQKSFDCGTCGRVVSFTARRSHSTALPRTEVIRLFIWGTDSLSDAFRRHVRRSSSHSTAAPVVGQCHSLPTEVIRLCYHEQKSFNCSVSSRLHKPALSFNACGDVRVGLSLFNCFMRFVPFLADIGAL